MSVAASGTQTATLTTEHTLSGAAITTAGTYVLKVDTTNLANGETVTLKIYDKVLTGSTEHLIYTATYVHVQAEPVKASPPCVASFHFKATLTQTGGTGRAYDWSIEKIA